MIYNEEKGNLFELDNSKYVFVHCISQDCAMGAGIAVEFNKRYSGMKDYCKRVITTNHLNFPCIIPYYKNENKKVINLITKNKYYNKPTYQSITKTIQDLAFICQKDNIKYLAMPRIGCGLDKLQWGKVREIIKKEFQNLDIEIKVRYL